MTTSKIEEEIEYKMKIEIIPFLFTSTNTWQILKETQNQNGQNIYIQKGNEIITIDSTTIAYMYIECKIVSLITFSGKNYILTHSLNHYEELLDDCFFRMNRQCIVNKNNIKKIQSSNNTIRVQLKIPEEKTISITNRKEKEFYKWIRTAPNYNEIIK